MKLYASINIPHAHENLIRIAAFVISEYSPLLVEEGKDPQKLFDVLNRHFSLCSEKGNKNSSFLSVTINREANDFEWLC